MDIQSILVNLAVVSFILVPYFLLIYLGQKQHREVGKIFRKEAKKLGLNIDEYDRWNNNALGIDFKQQKLLLAVRKDQDVVVETISLSNIKASTVKPVKHTAKGVDKPIEVLDKVYLELTPYDGTTPIMLCLFDAGYTFEQDYEIKHAEKWSKLINSRAMAPVVRNKAA